MQNQKSKLKSQNLKLTILLIVVCFVVFCEFLVAESVMDSRSLDSARDKFRGNDRGGSRHPCILLQQTAPIRKEISNGTGIIEGHSDSNVPVSKSELQPELRQGLRQNEIGVRPDKEERLEPSDFADYGAVGGSSTMVTLGSIDRASGFKFQLQLSSKGASVRDATFSEFNDRALFLSTTKDEDKNPKPLVILSPVRLSGGDEILPMTITNFGLFLEPNSTFLRPFVLDRLSWQSLGVEKTDGGAQSASFQAVIEDGNSQPVIKLIKTYKISHDSYLLDCSITVENRGKAEQKVRFDLAGPCGLGREDIRTDMRKVIACFKDSKGRIESRQLDKKKMLKARTVDELRLNRPAANFNFLWAAAVNKYFAAILVPLPDKGKEYCDWAETIGYYYNPDNDSKADSGDETIGLDLRITPTTLAPAGQQDSIKQYNFQLYLGPKDKSYFDRNEMYRNLGFVHTIDFPACCCPANIINPLAFGILAVMKWMHGIIGNYGVVIIILVFLMRLAMHPITKMSQVSMNKMTKLSPKAEEIRKKYANNKVEMNKQIMALYKEQGASPIMGMLPMLAQMPIWIALWSAVYASIDLRGAAFLPFWITDLSSPDSVVRFSTIILPFGWKVNSLSLLPILMGVAFYLQQKLMPSQAAASPNPQAAQQQKMMMWMMPVLFPLMLYNAPSGVNLYIMASTFAGVIEQYVIRKHIQRKEEEESQGLVAVTSKTGGKVKKKKPKPFYKS